MKFAIIRNTVFAGMLVLLVAGGGAAQGWMVSPSRQEITLRPGETRTFAIRVEREAGKGPAAAVRFTATPGDWDISRAGDVMLAPAGTTPLSANSWMIYTPSVFQLNAEGNSSVRVTISVPTAATPAVYRTSLFFEEHSAVPEPASGTRRMVLRYRLSTLIYVVVPSLEKAIEVQDVAVTGSREEGLTLTALFDNTGTHHLRPEHWVEITDADGKMLVKTEPIPTMVLLPKHQLEVRLVVPKDKLPAASSYNVRYVVDADRELPLKATTVSVVNKP